MTTALLVLVLLALGCCRVGRAKTKPCKSQTGKKEDLLHYFDRLPPQVKDALNKADMNGVLILRRDMDLRVRRAAKAARLIRDLRFVDETKTRAVTPVDGNLARYRLDHMKGVE
jgi:hypothetical protein